jgi:hypothetical protein
MPLCLPLPMPMPPALPRLGPPLIPRPLPPPLPAVGLSLLRLPLMRPLPLLPLALPPPRALAGPLPFPLWLPIPFLLQRLRPRLALAAAPARSGARPKRPFGDMVPWSPLAPRGRESVWVASDDDDEYEMSVEKARRHPKDELVAPFFWLHEPVVVPDPQHEPEPDAGSCDNCPSPTRTDS